MSVLETIWQDNLKRGKLQLPRCQRCLNWNWYPLPACKQCQSLDLEWTSVNTVGRVYSWTRVHRNFSGTIMPKTPYIVGLIELCDAKGVRIPGYYLGEDEAVPTINNKVTLRPYHFEDNAFWAFQNSE